jgi:RNA polymerase sigma-70 factor, ECF subfamily
VDPLSPEDLMRWCQRTLPRDTRAFQELVTTYKLRVFRTAYRMMGNHADAEEIAQDVFLRVYQNIHSLDEPAALTGWIYRITVNACLNELARRNRRPDNVSLAAAHEDGSEHGGVIDTGNATPEEAALRRELQRCIEAVLAELNAVERAVVILRDLEDRSYQEVADTLRVSLSAAKMRIHRARLAFQKLFDRICPDLRSAG